MSAIDVMRSFAESCSGDHETIRDGVTYWHARELVRTVERLESDRAALVAIVRGYRKQTSARRPVDRLVDALPEALRREVTGG